VWLVDSSTVAVKLLVDAGRAGKRRLTTEVPFGTPFETGQVIDIGTMRLKVLAIRAGGGTIRHGSAAAGSLEALVCRVMR
jgi:uncharacterized Zn finger protein